MYTAAKVVHDDLRAALRELQGMTTTQTAASTCNDDDFAIKITHGMLLKIKGITFFEIDMAPYMQTVYQP